MLTAKDARNLVPVDPRQALSVVEDAVRAAAVLGRMSIITNFGPFGAGSGPLFDTVVSQLVLEGYGVVFDPRANVTTVSWGY